MRITLLTLSLFAAACPGDGKPDSETTGETTAATGGSETTAATTAPTTGSTPDLPPPTGMCRTDADCMNIEFQCVPPGSGGGCGGATGCILQGEPCVDDASCGGSPDAPQICVADPCCGDSFCQPGCVGPDSCGPVGMCGPDARCVPRSCDAADPCPANFSCIADTCAVTPCESDAQCTGVCLLGSCSTGFGTCEESPS
jgi:hypothetical protein